MSSSVVETYRPLYVQDFATSASFAQVTDTVLSLGPGILLTPLVLAGNDTAAAAAGCPVGAIYANNGGAFIYLKARLT